MQCERDRAGAALIGREGGSAQIRGKITLWGGVAEWFKAPVLKTGEGATLP